MKIKILTCSLTSLSDHLGLTFGWLLTEVSTVLGIDIKPSYKHRSRFWIPLIFTCNYLLQALRKNSLG